MEPTRIPSLKELTLIQVIGDILNEENAYQSLLTIYPPLDVGSCERIIIPHREMRRLCIEKTIFECVLRLEIPTALKNELACLIKPCFKQIEAMICFHKFSFDWFEQAPIVIGLLWTSEGTINKKKIAELLVQDENLSIIKRFEIACVYCLEDQIYSLWPDLPNQPFKDMPWMIDSIFLSSNTTFWVHFLTDKLDEVILQRGYETTDVLGFFCSADNANDVACRYFLEKLTSEVKESALIRTSKLLASRRLEGCRSSDKIYFTDILCVLLSVMSEKQQSALFSFNVKSVLHCFFDWPRRNLINKISLSFWTSLQFSHCNYMLTKLRKRISKGRRDCDYQMMFKVFWQQIPNEKKEKVIRDCHHAESLLIKLFEVLEEENMRLILNDTAVIMQTRVAFGLIGRKIYEALICYNKLNSFKFFIEKCALSKIMLRGLERNVESYITNKLGEQRQNDKLVRIREIIIQECTKRENMDGDDYSIKKFCGTTRVNP